MRRVLVAVAAVLVAGLTAAQAGGYVLERRPSGPRVITFANAAPQHDWAIRVALQRWMETGAQIEFVRVPEGEAELIFGYQPGPPVLAGEAEVVERDTHPGSEDVRVGDARVRLPRFSSAGTARAQRFLLATIAAHEVGHVLGLEHEDRTCALMNSVITNQTPEHCASAPPGRWRCGLIERDDVAGAVRLYGGRPRLPRPRTCSTVTPPPGPPTDAAVELDRARGRAVLRWLNVPSSALRSVLVVRGRGCPRRPTDGRRQTVRAASAEPGSLSFPLEPGASCFSLWSRDAAGRLSQRPVTARTPPLGAPEPPGEVSATAGPALPPLTSVAVIRWRTPPDRTIRAIVIARGDGECPRSPVEAADSWRWRPAGPGRPDATADLAPPAGDGATGPCYAVFSQDALGQWSGPATAYLQPAGGG